MSILPPKFGIQKLWITSAAVTDTAMGLPTGTTISFAVENAGRPPSRRVAHPPPILLADHLDGERTGLRHVGVAHDDEPVGQQHRQDDDGKGQSAKDDGVAAAEPGPAFGRREDGVEQQSGDGEKDQGRARRHDRR